jgi:hypothetical protein
MAKRSTVEAPSPIQDHSGKPSGTVSELPSSEPERPGSDLDDEAISRGNAAAERLERCKKDWEAAAGKAREKLWTLLGAIFVAHHFFVRTESESRKRMMPVIKWLPGYSKALKPSEKSLLELMIIYAVGLDRETAGTRSQYAAAITRAIEDRYLERTEEAFVAWLKRKGGIIKAGYGSTEKIARFNFPAFKEHIKIMERRAMIDLQFDPVAEAWEDFVVVFATVVPGEPNKLAVIDVLADENLIKRTSEAVSDGRAKKLPEDQQTQLLHNQRLWALNRVTLKLANRVKKPVTWADADSWTLAHQALDGEDKDERRMFSAFKPAHFSDPEGTNKLELEVVNPEFHELDPGRYIPFAKQGELLPYDPDDERAINLYVRANTEPYVYAKPIDLPQDTDAKELDLSPKETV